MSSNGNIFRVTGHLCGEFTGPGDFPAQRPVTRSFDVFFDLHPNKWLSKQWWGWWFETQSCPLWRHRNGSGEPPFCMIHAGKTMPCIPCYNYDPKCLPLNDMKNGVKQAYISLIFPVYYIKTLTSTSWNNSLIIGICPAASARRHALTFPSYKIIPICQCQVKGTRWGIIPAQNRLAVVANVWYRSARANPFFWQMGHIMVEW